MSDAFDSATGHRYFSAEYFNRVWDFLAREDRSADEDQQMLSMSHASIAHWRDRDDCGAQQLSIGYWQLPKVYAELGIGAPAKNYAVLCLDVSDGLGAFYLGYAHEALCRAEKMVGNESAASEQLARAHEFLALVSDEGEKQMLADDLGKLT